VRALTAAIVDMGVNREQAPLRRPKQKQQGLFDQLIGEKQQCLRHFNFECLCSPEINDHLEFSRLLYRKIPGLCTLQDKTRVISGNLHDVQKIRAITQELPALT
jgi:hypothetical protein